MTLRQLFGIRRPSVFDLMPESPGKKRWRECRKALGRKLYEDNMRFSCWMLFGSKDETFEEFCVGMKARDKVYMTKSQFEAIWPD